MLISSLFMFNSTGAIDESSISQLSFVSQLAEHISQKSGDVSAAQPPPSSTILVLLLKSDFFLLCDGWQVLDPTDTSTGDNSFPAFIWVLRDFTLQLEDEYGETITEDQYLNDALANEQG